MPDDQFAGIITIHDYDNSTIMTLNGATGELTVGGGFSFTKGGPSTPGHAGSITVKTNNGLDRVVIAQDPGGFVNLYDAPSNHARIMLNADSKYILLTTELKKHPGPHAVIRLDGETGIISAGGNDLEGELALFPGSIHAVSPADDITKATINLTSKDGTVRAGGAGIDGKLLVYDKQGVATIAIDGGADPSGAAHAAIYLRASDGTVQAGGHGQNGQVLVLDKNNQGKITLDGASGDVTLSGYVTLSNADCAEDFDLADPAGIEPGTVMVFDDCGKIRLSTREYDRKVAGIISGAGDYKPGIILDRKAPSPTRQPIALVGKVFCQVDAATAPIGIGDQLTTSSTPGHAMKASDPVRAFGAVLGKALQPLAAGRGLIPVLVALG